MQECRSMLDGIWASSRLQRSYVGLQLLPPVIPKVLGKGLGLASEGVDRRQMAQGRRVQLCDARICCETGRRGLERSDLCG